MMSPHNTIRTNILSAITALQRKKTFPSFVLPDIQVTHPDTLDHGDYTTNVALVLAKEMKKNPREIAEMVKGQMSNVKGQMIDRIEVAGPGFINLWLSHEWLSDQISTLVRNPKTFLKSAVGRGKIVIVELSSVNIAKEMNIGHFRSNIIGDALANIYEALGYRVVRDNHLGDWGTQFGKLIVAVKRSERNERSERNMRTFDLPTMMQLYVQFHKDAEQDESLNDAAREETKKLQDGDPQNRKLWKMFVDLSLAEFQKVYDRLGTRFDTMHGESFYHDLLSGVVQAALRKGVAKKSEGAVIIEFDDLPPAIIQKSDGAFNYTTTDLATVQYRAKTYKPFRVLYVVANEQALHFSQVFAAAKKLGYKNTGELVHVKFGMALGSDGKKFSTRRGETIRLVEVMDEARTRAHRLVEKSEMTDAEKGTVAEIVGIGALKYNDLSQNRVHDIAFDWERMLSTTGNSAPYLQYVAVRIHGILRKAKNERGRKGKMQWTEEERTLARLLYRLSEILEEAARTNEPHRLAEFLYSVASAFHVFYDHCPVLTAPPDVRGQRLQLIRAVHRVITEGLQLLGIKTPERM